MVAIETIEKGIATIVREVCIIVLALVFTTIGPLLLILLSPVYLLRFCVSRLSPYVRPDLGKILCTRSSMVGVDNLIKNPKSNLVVAITLKGRLELENVQKTFDEKVINLKNASGELKHPELQQYPYKWMGFLFWKWDTKFDLKAHIHCCQNNINNNNSTTVNTEKDLLETESYLVSKPFLPETSPWELYVMQNYKPNEAKEGEEYSVFLLRIHHSVADGYSILKLLLSDVGDGTTDKVAKPNFNYARKSSWQQFTTTLSFIVRSPYEMARLVIDSTDWNEWKLTEKKLSDEYTSALTKQLSLDYLKEIRYAHNVCLTSVIIAGVSGAIRKSMLKRKVSVPKAIHSFTPLPMPGHPDKLRNFMSLGIIAMAVGESDPVLRLQMIFNSIKGLKESTVPLTAFLLMPILGGLFSWMVRITSRNVLTTVAISNFPGPAEISHIFDHECTDLYFGAGLLPGTTGMGFYAISYSGTIKIKAAINKSILATNSDVDEMVQYMHEEFEILRNQEKV